jgi:two-component system LytT family response regulator
VIPVGEILYLEAQDDYVEIVTTGGRHLKLETISRLETLLDAHQFCRIHRSYLLNTEFLRKIERLSRSSYRVLLENGVHLPVSKSGHKRLLERF